MNRRAFSLIAATAGLGANRIAPARSPSNPSNKPTAPELYRRALVLDCNLDPGFDDSLPLSKAVLSAINRSGVSVMKTTIGGYNNGFEETLADIAFILQTIEVHPDVFMQVRAGTDFERAKRTNKHGIIFSFESVAMLDGKRNRIELFRHLGVRVMQLSYNGTSPFGSGVMAPSSAGGLSPLGRDAIAEMNTLGVAIDLSHANAQTTNDAMIQSSRPVLMTHGGCSAIYAHPRNKTDEQCARWRTKEAYLVYMTCLSWHQVRISRH